jgi:hypothetical protein
VRELIPFVSRRNNPAGDEYGRIRHRREISQAFGGSNHPSANGWHDFRCPAPGHDDKTASCGAKDGRDGWIWVKCHAGCDRGAILDAIEAKGLKVRRAGSGAGRKPPGDIFAGAKPIDAAFPYFHERGIDVGVFPDLGRAVRYSPALWHKDSQTEKPALVAAVVNCAAAPTAIQRLYLTGDRKAKACKPMSLGSIRGLAIQLGPPTETLYVSEGLEDAMTAQQAAVEMGLAASAWAAVGAQNMPNLVPPEAVKTIVFLGQNNPKQPDEHDPAFARFVVTAARRLAAEGKQVPIAWPPAGVKDINDLVRGKTGKDLATGYVQARAMLTGAETEAPPAKTAWQELYMTDERGKILPNAANALIALQNAPELAPAFAYDEIKRMTMLVAPLPATTRPETLPRTATDADLTDVEVWLQRNGMPKMGRDPVFQAVDRRALERPFHRLRDWLSGLKWDFRPRLDTWLTYYLGAEDSLYHRAIDRMFLIAMVARVLASRHARRRSQVRRLRSRSSSKIGLRLPTMLRPQNQIVGRNQKRHPLASPIKPA